MENKSKKSKWSKEEVGVLVEEICGGGGDVLKKKFGRDVSNSDRKGFWQETTQKVNAVGGQSRSVAQVEKKWRDLKSQTKAKEVQRRNDCMKTGGGPTAMLPLSAIEDKILSTVPSCSLEGIAGGIDSSKRSTDATQIEEVLKTRSDQERMMHSQIENVIAGRSDVGSPSKTSTDVRPTIQSRKRTRGATEDLIIEMEQEKLKEIKGIRETLKSIDTTLKELLQIKKQKSLIGDEVYDQFNF